MIVTSRTNQPEMSFRSVRRALAAFTLLLALVLQPGLQTASAQGSYSFERPPIDYHNRLTNNHTSRLQQAPDQDTQTLEYDRQRGYLPAILQALEISPTSQVLVYSKTSQQLRRIDSRHPRALYYNDQNYVGWVLGGEVLEIITTDAQLGTVFYTLKQQETPRPKFERDRGQCLICHASRRTHEVPGPLVRSLYTGRNGQPAFGMGTFNTDHSSPFTQRWGGYYVTGTHGNMQHMGNKFFSENPGNRDPDLAGGSNITNLDDFLNTAPYLTPHSDLVALMVLEHQVQMQNLLTLAQFEEFTATHYDRTLNKNLGRPEGSLSNLTRRRIGRAGEKLVRYMLFADEFPLSSPVTGTSEFSTYFARQGPRDQHGRSLRDLDQQKRLFKYPLSYQVYTPAFDRLPAGVSRYVKQRLQQILRGQDKPEDFPRLKMADRKAILEILQETKPELLKPVQ